MFGFLQSLQGVEIFYIIVKFYFFFYCVSIIIISKVLGLNLKDFISNKKLSEDPVGPRPGIEHPNNKYGELDKKEVEEGPPTLSVQLIED